ncbi:MAG: guanylate kinase [Paludibacteraceae bacterium]|jgi:guanylate kinase|nr:guanylate kinase [Paludibacteraceae bacterium]
MILIFSAPSGSGKSTLVQHLLDTRQDMELSISATTRAPRGKEQDGREYYFISPERFEQLISDDAFVEWEQVYKGTYYGTLKSEIDRIESAGHHVVFDIDVKGGINVKRLFGDKARAIFIAPPSIDALRERLTKRGTDSPEKIEERLAKAEIELADAPLFDTILVNDDLNATKAALDKEIAAFIG